MVSHRISFFVVLLVLVLINRVVLCNGGKTGAYCRQSEKATDMPLDTDVFEVPPGYNAPQQVHITEGDHEGRATIISWVTQDEPGSNTIIYWNENDTQRKKVEGKYVTYKDYVTDLINPAQYDTKYYYAVGVDHVVRNFWFITPPAPSLDVPYTFGLIDDIGQTYISNQTLTHYELNPRKGQTVLYVGDLSNADNYPCHDNGRWDTWGRFTERSTAYQAWIWRVGNHELDFAPEINENEPFKPFTHRYPTLYKALKSTTPFWYSIKRGPAYIIILSSYSAYGTHTPQYDWLEKELPKVNRSETPWLLILNHCPWYNSNHYHFMEGESMRVMFEPWFIQYKVDVVFSGHVHAYERSERISNIEYNIENGKCSPIKDIYAPVYINIGDGGNQEGLAANMREPQPAYSVYREASFGHAILDIKNQTHACYSWHRNQDGVAIEADSIWFFNRHWHIKDDTLHTDS